MARTKAHATRTAKKAAPVKPVGAAPPPDYHATRRAEAFGRADVETDPGIRALGIERHFGFPDAEFMTTAEMFEMLFPGDSDPIAAMIARLADDASVIRHAVEGEGDVSADVLSMSVYALESRLHAMGVLYRRATWARRAATT